MKHVRFIYVLGILSLALFMTSCDNELHISMPEGPEGPAGKSAYELWVEGVNNGSINWSKDRTTIDQFYLYMKGIDGKDGQNGLSAYELWVIEVQKGIKDPHNPSNEWDKSKTAVNDFWYFLTGADGKDGKNGSTPVIGDNGNWWIDGIDTGKPSKGADGKDGSRIEISYNNTWIIDGTDTGVPVNGKDGQDGKNGSVVTIGTNGNWFIDGIDTTIPARGKDGSNGSDGTNGAEGMSAYEVWIAEVMKGLENPHKPGEQWDKTKISMNDYWYYLRGKAGVDGQNGKDGSVITIGDNGNWYIDGQDTNVPAKGKDGQDGKGDKVTIVNGYWHINGENTGIPAKGEDGKDGNDGQPGRDGSVVTIGDNDNWFIDGEDTGIPAFGKDGQNGNDGQDGAEGLSAYELWKKEVATGNVDHPKKPGEKWPKNKDTVDDFWEYLTGNDGQDGNNGQDGNDGQDGKDGTDGQSAYELWKEEVEKGLENPHEPGTDWPKDRTTIQDFWEYLRGADGTDGMDGQDGETVIDGQVVFLGVPNVISQFSQQQYEEHVRWTDGAVLFVVYNEVGTPSPGAKVKGMPGVDPNKVFTADASGQFLMQKEELPEGKNIGELTGSVEVTYKNSKGKEVTEQSASNTYVPNRIHVRLIVSSSVVRLTNSTATTTFRMERNVGTPGAKWERIPSHLGGLEQTLKWYELSDPNNPDSYNESTLVSQHKKTISQAMPTGIHRFHIVPPYMKKPISGEKEWDGQDHYYTATLESYYGETPAAPIVIHVPPVQYMPTIGNIEGAKGYSTDMKNIKELTVVFDSSHINPSHVYESDCKKQTRTIGGQSVDYWLPVVANFSEVEKQEFMKVRFMKSGGGSGGDQSTDNRYKLASFINNKAVIEGAYMGSAVYIYAEMGDFVEPEKLVGKISYNIVSNTLTLEGVDDEVMNTPTISDIEVN